MSTNSVSERKINSGVALEIEKEKNKEPIKGERNILITSALPYVNNIPHLGNIIGSVLSADVFARYSRARRYNTLFVCGTDEYGTATETKALEEGTTCQELCDKYNAIHKQVYEWFELDFDYFGRTTTRQQTEIAQDIFMKLYKNGYLSEDAMIQLFCEKCQRFLADRYVEGTCPKCNYEDARGDQCDSCGQLLNATELVNPRCKLEGSTPIMRESKHMFLDLDTLQKTVEDWVIKTSVEGKWSTNSKTITNSWLKEGLKPRCITRDLKWGTPVPLEEMKEKVFYVWFDAPIGYLSITANYTPHWEKWWKNPDNVKLYQFMGKDNVPFHTVIFPSSLFGTGEDWTLLYHINTTEYLNYENTKFSKSRNIGVFGTDAKDTGINVSVWRYYLIASRPETNDSVFTWKEFIAYNNNELLANLGNFVNRVIKFSASKYNSIVPEFSYDKIEEKEFIENIDSLLKNYIETLENVKLRAGLEIAMEISRLGNGYLQESKLDNSLFQNNIEKCSTVIGIAINLIYLLSALFFPYMPSTTESICRQLNAPLRDIPDTWTIDILPGHKLGKAEYLFKKIDDKKEEEYLNRYGGGDGKVAETKKKAKKGKNVNTVTNNKSSKIVNG
ncbi:methionyl-tRNA synthetase [Rhizophagus irregularis]|uniref:methionine--tRNA ligase n=1 Tax=Rhizophagus irregularis TaxID=588596 RepID=A0A2N0R9S4_9GLOM|nr:methionyl-tRNA synthetase [Rhizophagus irregularis]